MRPVFGKMKDDETAALQVSKKSHERSQGGMDAPRVCCSGALMDSEEILVVLMLPSPLVLRLPLKPWP